MIVDLSLFRSIDILDVRSIATSSANKILSSVAELLRSLLLGAEAPVLTSTTGASVPLIVFTLSAVLS